MRTAGLPTIAASAGTLDAAVDAAVDAGPVTFDGRPMTGPFTVIGVTDTRDLVEDGDRWVRISGSGDTVTCERCSRSIEVHATIEDADGNTFTVGTGCMGADTDKAIRSAAGKASRRASKAAAEAAQTELRIALQAVASDIDSVELPGDDELVVTEGDEGMKRYTYTLPGHPEKAFSAYPVDNPAERASAVRSQIRRRLFTETLGGKEERAAAERSARWRYTNG